jgi:hypothetical protein
MDIWITVQVIPDSFSMNSACMAGHFEIVNYLYSRNKVSTSINGLTIQLTLERGYYEIVIFLMEKFPKYVDESYIRMIIENGVSTNNRIFIL